MTKEELEKEISVLEERVEANKTMSENYVNNLAKLQKKLEDINKPELTPLQFDKIQEAIERAVSEFDFTDINNFEIDYSLDYDGRVQCETHEFINGDDLVMEIVAKVCNLFKEIEDEETND